nr:hypothetical protein Iba_chr14dCG13660 [Ipomoea batatas]
MSEVAFAILFGAAGTVALLTMCAWLDCCDKIVDFDLLQTREETGLTFSNVGINDPDAGVWDEPEAIAPEEDDSPAWNAEVADDALILSMSRNIENRSSSVSSDKDGPSNPPTTPRSLSKLMSSGSVRISECAQAPGDGPNGGKLKDPDGSDFTLILLQGGENTEDLPDGGNKPPPWPEDLSLSIH